MRIFATIYLRQRALGCLVVRTAGDGWSTVSADSGRASRAVHGIVCTTSPRVALGRSSPSWNACLKISGALCWISEPLTRGIAS